MRGRQADLTATLLTAWTYAGSKDGKQALATVDKLKNERAFNQFREYHAALIADVVGNSAEAEKRFKAAYEGERNTLQVVDAYGRFLAKRGRKDEALTIYKAFDDVAAAPSRRSRRHEGAGGGQAAPAARHQCAGRSGRAALRPRRRRQHPRATS